MKRIAAIQDFSCVGKCSLTAALPIISAAGVECCGIPTALLSNHTGFSSYHIRDLTGDMEPVFEQLGLHGITFDAIYTGYAASVGQIDLICGFIDKFKGDNTTVFVDPVMGDDGRLYSGLGEDFPEKMRALCSKADVILPNYTEACLLTGAAYTDNPTWEDYKDRLRELVGLGAKLAVITGVRDNSDKSLTGAFCYDGSSFFGSYGKNYPLSCAGTGDVFASALVGAFVRLGDFNKAHRTAVMFTSYAVGLTAADPERRFYGVSFEKALPYYISLLEGMEQDE